MSQEMARWLGVKVNAITELHAAKMKTTAMLTAVRSLDAGKTDKQVLFDVKNVIGEWADRELNATVGISVVESVNKGRDWVAERDREQFQGAQYSAILDETTCPLCEQLDEKVVSLDNPDYDKFSPPIHPNCRCFVDPRVPIYTINGWKPIKNISIGDEVLTHKGRFKKVIAISQVPNYRGDTITIKVAQKIANGIDSQVTVTPEHPFYILRNGQWQWINAEDIKVNDKVGFLAHKCKRNECKNLTRYDAVYCSQTCLSKEITKKQWQNLKHKENISQKNRKSMIEQSHQQQFTTVSIIEIRRNIHKVINKTAMVRYNFSVEEDESYIAKGYVVHNCIWVYIGKEEEGVEVDWETPDAELVKEKASLIT